MMDTLEQKIEFMEEAAAWYKSYKSKWNLDIERFDYIRDHTSGIQRIFQRLLGSFPFRFYRIMPGKFWDWVWPEKVYDRRKMREFFISKQR